MGPERNIFSINPENKRWLREVLISHDISVSTHESVTEEVREEAKESQRSAFEAFRQYADYISPYLPKVHGGVLLYDNGLDDTLHEKPESVMVEMNGKEVDLFRNRTFMRYPTQKFFLPRSYEIVAYQGGNRKELPTNRGDFDWERVRDLYPDSFIKAVEPELVELHPILRMADRDRLEDNLDSIEEALPDDAEIDEEVLAGLRKQVFDAVDRVDDEIKDLKTEKLPKIKNRIFQLQDALEKNFGVRLLKLAHIVELGRDYQEDGELVYLPHERELIVGRKRLGFIVKKLREATSEEWFDFSRYLSSEIINTLFDNSPHVLRDFLESIE